MSKFSASFKPLNGVVALVVGTVLFGFGLSSQALAQDHNRVVAVGGSVTEIVYALGEEDRLVARDSTSTYPDEATALPDVGYIRALSPEGVLSVKPDLVLLLDGSGPAETVDVLKASEVEIVNIPDEASAEGIVAKVKAIGDALGVAEKADALADKVEEDIAVAQSGISEKVKGQKVVFVLSYRDGRIMASGADTQASAMIELAGATNAMNDFSGYKQLSDESILTAQPDVILMMDNGHGTAVSADQLFAHPALSVTPAAKNKRLITMPGLYLLGFGPRTADAIRDLADQFAEAG
ncbi:MAG: ABC transporter substrate-binding protein [Rhodobacteraceae bacterium]|nr:ABC transporter substrate-binding protein [Paracoccaceae bacterium]